MNKTNLFFSCALFMAFILAAGCDSKGRSGAEQNEQPKINCEFGSLTELVGKKEKEVSQCFKSVSAALIGDKREFSISVVDKGGQLIVILSRLSSDAGLIIRDVMLLPKLEQNDTFLFNSCYTNYESGFVDAVAIAKYARDERFLTPKRSWIIDYEAGKIKPNEHAKITCANLSYGV